MCLSEGGADMASIEQDIDTIQQIANQASIGDLVTVSTEDGNLIVVRAPAEVIQSGLHTSRFMMLMAAYRDSFCHDIVFNP
jgi:hypothetical protein